MLVYEVGKSNRYYDKSINETKYVQNAWFYAMFESKMKPLL